jgi:hypothetical protein
MVATLWQCSPNSTSQSIINAIRQSASQAANPDSLLGYGIPDFLVACMLLSGLNPELAGMDEILIVNGNPFSKDLAFSFYSKKQQDAVVALYDLTGRTVRQTNITVSPFNSNKNSLDTEGLGKGIYILTVTTPGGRQSVSAIKY